MSLIGIRGFRLATGSWKMTCMRRRIFLRSSPLRLKTSWPSNRAWPSVGVLQTEEGPSERGLAAAGLADQPEDLAATDLEADAVDGLDVGHDAPQDPGPDRVVGLDESSISMSGGRTAPGDGARAVGGRVDGVGHAAWDRTGHVGSTSGSLS